MRHYWILLFMLFTSLVKADTTGTIMAVNIQDRTIQINQKQFTLADKLVLTTPLNNLIGQSALQVGQKIEYQISEEALTPEVKKIHIISGYDDAKFKK